MEEENSLYIYRAVAPGEWAMVERYIGPGYHAGLQTFDINRNGRDELLWEASGYIQGPLRCLVLEHPAVSPSAVGDSPSFATAQLSVAPTPCRLQANLRVPAAARQAASLATFDVTGRLLERRVPIRDASGQLLWMVQDRNPGIYYLRLEDHSGATLAVGRAVVVR